ncbi:hypothetical protein PG994_014929 [Apiospora phragmitis]|uniref:Uncharacterized protein n=1 Tax=Apiospora phragmitis TaxID=2905665 RepID=A0ABR1SV12_9PEZI
MAKPREPYENSLYRDLHLSQRLLTTPILGTNCRLEKVARMTTKRAKEVLRQQLSGGDDVTASAGFAAARKELTDAVAGLCYWYTRSQEYEKAIHDLKVMYTHYLSLKYEYRRHDEFRRHVEFRDRQAMHENTLNRPPSPGPAFSQGKRDVIGALALNLNSYLLLGRNRWRRRFVLLRKELRQLREWKQDGPPKSKAPSTPNCTWLMKVLEFFMENDMSKAMEAIRFAVTNAPDPFQAMSYRHVELVDESRKQVALDDVDRDLGSLAVWVPKAYDTEVLKRAIVSYKFKVLNYISEVGESRNGVQLR